MRARSMTVLERMDGVTHCPYFCRIALVEGVAPESRKWCLRSHGQPGAASGVTLIGTLQ